MTETKVNKEYTKKVLTEVGELCLSTVKEMDNALSFEEMCHVIHDNAYVLTSLLGILRHDKKMGRLPWE